MVWNRVEVVPKNWKTGLRSLASQKVIPLQLAFDAYAKARLQKRGIDLSDQGRNQQLAKEGSISGKLATIDLSMASDTLSYNAVALLIPSDWFKYLSSVRSPCYRFGSKLYSYAKFSSMGNGATFALETLIFAAAAYAVGSKRFSVYGDDIIVETELFEPLSALLCELGFTVNQEKSFATGPFRESCGGNFFEGIDITPFYVRKWGKQLSLTAHNINGLASIATPGGSLWNYLLSMAKPLVKERRIPLVPFNGDSMSGIWIPSNTAYGLNLIHSRHRSSQWIPRYKAFVTRSKEDVVIDYRTLFLWHHGKFVHARSESAASVLYDWHLEKLKGNSIHASRSLGHLVESSRVPVAGHKYARGWVRWNPPTVATPPHLYWWGDELTA
jgi:hypothetical protein